MASIMNLTPDEWSLIGDNVTDITYQNNTIREIYIGFTASNTAPVETVGLKYRYNKGELKKSLGDLTHISNPTYVWAKPVGGTQASVIVES